MYKVNFFHITVSAVLLIACVVVGVLSIFPISFAKPGPGAFAASNAMLWSQVSRRMVEMKERSADIYPPIPWSISQKELIEITGPLDERDENGNKFPVLICDKPQGPFQILMMGQCADSLGLHFAITQDGMLIKVPPIAIEANSND